MSEYGIKIQNFEAGSIYGYSLGIRDRYDITDAMLTNSLFSNFLKSNGLNIHNGKSTRDIICIEFNYGTRSYEEEVKYYQQKIKKDPDSPLVETYKMFEERAHLNKEKFKKKSADEIRYLFYNEGVEIEYKTYARGGRLISTEKIRYKMLYRTPGKAKKGMRMFIREELYDIAHNFLYMGIELSEDNPAIVEMEAYSSLITSSIIGTVKIYPEEIFIFKDVDSFTLADVISIETNELKHCQAIKRDNYRLKNTMFDGQALGDISLFKERLNCPEEINGYALLRHHMCKIATFKTDIQKFMHEYYGDKYETATLTDMYGIEHRVKDIKLITTENAIKWKTFGVDLNYWFDWVRANGCEFGIVKTAHKSKLGEVQRMSYQMVNALDMDIMPEVVRTTSDYIDKLKTNNEEFLNYLRKNSNFSNDYDALVALVEHNPDFIRSDYFRRRKEYILRTYVLNFKSGKVIQDADNLVIVGSPYAMLLAAVGDDVNNDPTFEQEDDAMQCWTARFRDGEYLAEFRSPFNSKNNMGHLHNVYHPYFDKYFDLGELVIAVNMNGTCFQDKNNGLGLRPWVSVQECA